MYKLELSIVKNLSFDTRIIEICRDNEIHGVANRIFFFWNLFEHRRKLKELFDIWRNRASRGLS